MHTKSTYGRYDLMIRIIGSLTDEKMGFCFFGSEEVFTEIFRLFRIKPRAGKDIEIRGFFIFRKMRGNGARFDKLDE